MKTNKDNQRQAVRLEYLAGIIDGEGCIRIKKAVQRGTKNHQYYTSISVGMVERVVLEMLQEAFGGSIREERLRTGRTLYRWQLHNRELCVKALNKLKSRLVVKRQQAELAIEFESKYRTLYGFSAKTYATKTEFDMTEYHAQIQLREESYQKMRKLNAVGAAATTN